MFIILDMVMTALADDQILLSYTYGNWHLTTYFQPFNIIYSPFMNDAIYWHTIDLSCLSTCQHQDIWIQPQTA